MAEPTVTDRLRDDILRGGLVPGARLVELQLAERYAVGRAAVRSALIALSGEGLVELAANRGATVRPVSISEAIQITEARAALESLAAAKAATAAGPDEHDELRRLVDEMRAAVTGDDATRYSELNNRLHRRVREIADHAVAAEVITNLNNRAAHHRYRLALIPGRPEQSLEQHAAIVEAIVAGDGPAAAAAMTAHLESVIDVLDRWGRVQGSTSLSESLH